jgi:hypothetical protein
VSKTEIGPSPVSPSGAGGARAGFGQGQLAKWKRIAEPPFGAPAAIFRVGLNPALGP